MYWIAWELLVIFAEAGLFLAFLHRNLGSRSKSYWTPLAAYVPIICTVYLINQTSLPLTVQLSIFVTMDVLYTILFFKGRPWECAAYGCVSVLISSVSNNIVLLSLAVFSNSIAYQSMGIAHNQNLARFIGMAIYLIVNASIYLLALRVRKSGVELPKKESFLFVASFLVCIMQSALAQQMGLDPLLTEHYGRFVSYLLISSSCFVFFVIWLQLIFRVYTQKHMVELDMQQVASERAHLDDMQSNYFALRAWRHDYHNHLQIIKYYVEQAEWGSLTEYLGELDQQFSMLHVAVSTENTVFNALVNTKMILAMQANVDLKVDAVIPERLPISDVSFCALLGNLLDNALEATKRQAAETNPWIRISARLGAEAFALNVVNSSDGGYRFLGNRLLSRKSEPDHGIGLTRVRQIVDSLCGKLTLAPGSNTFEVDIRIPRDAQLEASHRGSGRQLILP